MTSPDPFQCFQVYLELFRYQNVVLSIVLRAVMNTLLGGNGAGCAEVPSPDELDDLKAAASQTQEATLRQEQ